MKLIHLMILGATNKALCRHYRPEIFGMLHSVKGLLEWTCSTGLNGPIISRMNARFGPFQSKETYFFSVRSSNLDVSRSVPMLLDAKRESSLFQLPATDFSDLKFELFRDHRSYAMSYTHIL